MLPKYSEVGTALLVELGRRGGEARPSDKNSLGQNIYDALADFFELDADSRALEIFEANGIARSKWENIVRWARNDLVKAKKIDGSQRGVWKLADAGRKQLAEVEAEEITQRDFRPSRKIDLEEFKKRLAHMEEIGAMGEIIVFEAEKARLISQGRLDLAKRVRHISLENVAAGFDILSFDDVGNELYIEVKSSSRISSSFELTRNELKTAEEMGAAYLIYRVTEVGEVPQIEKLENPSKLISEGRMQLKPTSFRVILTV